MKYINLDDCTIYMCQTQLHNKEDTMKTKKTAVCLTLFLALLIMVTPVLAGHYHFGNVNASGPDANGNLIVDFSSFGLYSIGASAGRDAIYACKPANGDFPSNPIQQEVTDTGGSGITSGYYDKNNVFRGEIIITPPPPPSFTCDGDLIIALAMISYDGTVIGGGYPDMNWITKPINGNHSATYYGYTP
jgi:hypothetical protein